MSSYLHKTRIVTFGCDAYPEKSEHIVTSVLFIVTTKDLISNTLASSEITKVQLPPPDFNKFISYKNLNHAILFEWIENVSPGLIVSIQENNIQKLQN